MLTLVRLRGSELRVGDLYVTGSAPAIKRRITARRPTVARVDGALAIDAALEALLARLAPEARMLQQIATSGRLARRLRLARRVQGWAAQERAARTDTSRSETRELNHLLRDCCSDLVFPRRQFTGNFHFHLLLRCLYVCELRWVPLLVRCLFAHIQHGQLP